MENKPESDSDNLEALQTLFYTSGSNQLKLISIADNKANVITAICTALIFLIIGFLTSDLTYKGKAISQSNELVLPLGILLAFCCIAAICSILALKPKIIRSKTREARSMLFFHSYYRMSLEDFKSSMKEMARSKDNIYDQMLTNMYNNGLVLERKYALLGFAYNIFLLAIVSSFITFVITMVF